MVTIILSFFAGFSLIIIALKEEREKYEPEGKKKFKKFSFWSIRIIISLISAVIVVWTALLANSAENETKSYQKQIQQKSDKILVLDSLINVKNDLINTKNDSLNKKSNDVIALQNELNKEFTGANSIPLLIADTMWGPELGSSFINGEGYPERLSIKLINVGNYPIIAVNIQYESFIVYTVETGKFPEIYLPGNATKEVTTYTLENLQGLQLNNPYGLTYKYAVSWKSLEYFFYVTIYKKNKIDHLRPNSFTIVSSYSYDKLKGLKTWEIKKILLKQLKGAD